jgi:hypothetical protein
MLFFGARLQYFDEVTVSFLSVRQSVRVEQLGSHWTEFHEICYLSIFGKSAEKIQV